MAEDTLPFAIKKGMLPAKTCRTKAIRLHGAPPADQVDQDQDRFARYGADATQLEALVMEDPALAEKLDAALPYILAEIVYAVRYEMERTVEDVLSRRTRALLLDARAARRAAPLVAQRMAVELGVSEEWAGKQVSAFSRLVDTYYLQGATSDRSPQVGRIWQP